MTLSVGLSWRESDRWAPDRSSSPAEGGSDPTVQTLQQDPTVDCHASGKHNRF